MPKQIVNYLTIILPILFLGLVAITFVNKANQEAEFEINIPDKFQLKLRTTKRDIEP